MADGHSNRRGRARSTVGSVGSRSRRKSSQLPAGNSTSGPAVPVVVGADRELVNELKSVAWRLTAAYATCATVQAALEGQMAEQDKEFARCLRSGVSDPVSRQIERLQALVGRLGGAPARSSLG